MFLTLIQYSLDIKWTQVNSTRQSHIYHNSAEADGTIYLLGGSYSSYIQNTTEYLNLPNMSWVNSFKLQNRLYGGCAVKVSFDEIIVIFGNYAPNIMYKYNVTSGQRTMLANTTFGVIWKFLILIKIPCFFDELVFIFYQNYLNIHINYYNLHIKEKKLKLLSHLS